MKKVCCVCLRIFTRINDVIRHINSVHENDSEYSSDDDIDENFQVPVDFKYKQLLEKRAHVE